MRYITDPIHKAFTTPARVLLLALFASAATACSDPTGLSAECERGVPDLDCPLPDLSGTWELTLPQLTAVGMTMAQGTCQFETFSFRLEMSPARAGAGFDAYSGEHSAIEGVCAEAVAATLGLQSGRVRLLQDGAIRAEFRWLTRSTCGNTTNMFCERVPTGDVGIQLTLQGACGDLPGCIEGGMRLHGTRRPSNRTLGGEGIFDIGLHSGVCCQSWTASRSGN